MDREALHRYQPRAFDSRLRFWMRDTQKVGADRMFSIEERSVGFSRRSAARSKPESLPDRFACGEGLGMDFKASSFQRYVWARNAPYALTDPCNPVKSQRMRPPSERTILIIQGAGCRRRQGFSAMADVDIDKLMRMAAFDHVRMLSEPCVFTPEELPDI